MSGVFGDYSRYYRLLNRDKDYRGEVAYLLGLIYRYATLPGRELLDLGCGGGDHDFHLAEAGYAVTGIDRSESMLAEAQKRLSTWTGPGPAPQFQGGDLTRLALGRTYPLIVSLFHVISYQTSDAALTAALAGVATHLEEGGLFIFDFWYGPAVLAQQPETRLREVEDEVLHVRRRAEPIHHQEQQVVEVNYTVEITSKADGRREVLQESHPMRYLFLPEVARFLAAAGLTLLTAEEWLTGGAPSETTWGVCVVARKGSGG